MPIPSKEGAGEGTGEDILNYKEALAWIGRGRDSSAMAYDNSTSCKHRGDFQEQL